jgi:endonuclease YncB( thermonuclease family)
MSLGALLAGPAAAAGLVTADPLPWTDKPLRIDRQGQSYQRVPADAPSAQDEAKFPIKISKETRLSVQDSGSFKLQGKPYRLASVAAVEPSKLCAYADGARWACGVRAKAALSRLIREGQAECGQRTTDGEVGVVECRRRGQDIARQLVSSGFAVAAEGDPRYLADEQAARQGKAGIWARSAGDVP